MRTSGLDAGYQHASGKSLPVLKNLSIDLKAGELVSLIGANGSGKSTLIKTLTGIIPALSGAIEIEGSILGRIRMSELSKKISVVLTERVEAGNLSVRSLIALGRYPYTGLLGGLSAKDKEIIERSIRITSLEKLQDRFIQELSDGERQKVMIARALAQETSIIFLDEPTAYLDIQNKFEIIRLLRKLTETENKCVVLSTHDLDLALQFSDRMLLLSEGEIISGCPEDLILQNQLDKLFPTGPIRFDKASNKFKTNNESLHKIHLRGEGIVCQLTQRALERNGYELSGNADISVEIYSQNNSYGWIVKDGNEVKFDNIELLINYLKKDRNNLT
ncbi:MAG: ABC transporter ATP-binding protein [Cytophagaceae bacterium]